MSSYVPPFPNLTFNTIFTAALSYDPFKDSESLESQIIAAFAVTSTSFYNSSLQANVVSRMTVERKNVKLIELFLHPPSTTTRNINNLSTIQMTPVLDLTKLAHPQTLVNTLKNSTYFSRSLRELRVQCKQPNLLLLELENLVALEVLDLQFFHSVTAEKAQELAVVARLPSLIALKLDLGPTFEKFGCFDFLGDLESNNGFRKLTVQFCSKTPHNNFHANFTRLCAKNLLTHLALYYCFTDDDLDVLIKAKLANLQSLVLTGKAAASPSKIADAIIACSSSSLTTLEVDNVSDIELVGCAEYLGNIVELRLKFTEVNGSFLREKGSCFVSNLEILNFSGSFLSETHLNDGFRYLSSLRSLNLFGCYRFVGDEALQHLTAAVSLEELLLSTITSASVKVIGQLTQLRSLHIWDVDHEIKSDEVIPLKNLVNLRKLTFNDSSGGLYYGILRIAESFSELTHVDLGRCPVSKGKKTQFSRDEVVYLLEKCWPNVLHVELDIDDARAVMPYLRRRFPHVDLGFENETLAQTSPGATGYSNVPQYRNRDD